MTIFRVDRVDNASSRGPRGAASIGIAATVALFGILSWPSAARADVVYGPPPPPPYGSPPPPPPGYYYAPPRRYYYYYDDREPPYAPDLGLDLEGAIPLNAPQFLDGNDLRGGGGIKVRLGEQLRLRGGTRLTPEVGYGYDHLFASDDIGDHYDWSMQRFFGGLRLAFGRILVPVIYGHIGYGWRTTPDPTVPHAGGTAFDFGGALDLHLRHLVIGVYVEYATIDAQPYAPEWMAIGLHLDLLF
jgi:hypothetical protein